MQLDLFAHTRDVMLRNELVCALEARDPVACEQALKALLSEFPSEAVGPPALIVLTWLKREFRAFASHAEVLRCIDEVINALEPALSRVLGEQSALSWLEPVWCQIAKAATRLEFQPDCAEAHPAALFARAGRWARVERHLNRIPSWRRIPVALGWGAEAQFHLYGLDRAWPLLAELAWCDPLRFAQVVRRLPANGLKGLLQQYERDFTTTAIPQHAWFPAWALIAHGDLRLVLQQAETPERSAPEQTCRTLLKLLSLERQGRHAEIIALRRDLRALSPELFDFYMQTRA